MRRDIDMVRDVFSAQKEIDFLLLKKPN